MLSSKRTPMLTFPIAACVKYLEVVTAAMKSFLAINFTGPPVAQ